MRVTESWQDTSRWQGQRACDENEKEARGCVERQMRLDPLNDGRSGRLPDLAKTPSRTSLRRLSLPAPSISLSLPLLLPFSPPLPSASRPCPDESWLNFIKPPLRFSSSRPRDSFRGRRPLFWVLSSPACTSSDHLQHPFCIKGRGIAVRITLCTNSLTRSAICKP